MTRKTKMLTMLAGGICSLGLTGAAQAEHMMKICEACDQGAHGAHRSISRSGDDGEQMIVIELDDSKRSKGGTIYYDDGVISHSGSGQALIERLSSKNKGAGCCSGDGAPQALRLLRGGGDGQPGNFARFFGGQHGGHGEIEIIIDGETIDLGDFGGLHGLHQLDGRRGDGPHKVIVKRFGDGDFSMGDLGIDDPDGDVEIEVIINGESVDLGNNKQLHKLRKHGNKGKKGKRHKGGKSVFLKSDGHNVWSSDDGEDFEIPDGAEIRFFGEGRDARGDSSFHVVPDEDGAIVDLQLALGGGEGDELHAWAVADQPSAPDAHDKRVMIGVTLGSISEALASQLGVDAEGVVMIENVMDGMPAQRSGLRRFDIITEIDGHDGVSTPALQKIIGSKSAGEKVELQVLRGGDPHTFTVELAEAPEREELGLTVDRLGDKGKEQALRELVRSSRGSNEQAQRALGRAKQRLERQRSTHRLHREQGEDIDSILDQLSELNGQIDDETMEKIRAQLSELGDQFEEFEFNVEMPNIEFFPGDDDDDDGNPFVVIEGDPGQNMFRIDPDGHGRSFTFPGGKGEFFFDVAPGDGEAHFAPGRENPFADRNEGLSDRLESLEERMERIESLLERLADKID